MKNLLIVFISIVLFSAMPESTKFITKNGKVSFYSDAPLEKIEAKNAQMNVALDTQTGDILFKVLIKSFIFEKALMQEHFNENYLESDKFPTSTFKGKIVNLSDIKFATSGTYNAKVTGKLTIHGVTKDVEAQGVIFVSNQAINLKSIFKIKIGDYNITIPGAVTGKIAKEVEITVDADLKPLKK